jgi:hypothetical protein
MVGNAKSLFPAMMEIPPQDGGSHKATSGRYCRVSGE